MQIDLNQIIPLLILYFQTIVNQSLRIGTNEVFNRFHPVTFLQAVTDVQDGEDRHHALQSPDAHVLSLRYDKLGILDIKKVTDLDGKIAITIDFFYAHLDFCHKYSSGFLSDFTDFLLF